jgi:hypothetical protein
VKFAIMFVAATLGGATIAWAQSASTDSTAQKPPTQANSLNCSDFHRNPEGTWTAVRPVTISGPSGSASFGAYAFFPPGAKFVGLDVGNTLEDKCLSRRSPS